MRRYLALFSILLLSSLWLFEVHATRPSILEVRHQPHDLGEEWEEIKRAQVSFVLELIHVYSDYEIYFLARDAELFYDTAVLVTEEMPQARARIHLLNVSRASVKSNHLLSYLAQEGISEQELSKGKKILFVDTGFLGTIPMGLRSLFPSKYALQIEAHLVSSSHSRIPSSRVFSGLDGSIDMAARADYMEEIIKHNNSALDYQLVGGRWIPVHSPEPLHGDLPAQAFEALKFQEDLVSSHHGGEYAAQIHQETLLWNELVPIFYGDLTESQKIQELKRFLGVEDSREFREAMVRDMIEVILMTRKSNVLVSGRDLGLPPLNTQSRSLAQLIDAYPNFKSLLAAPEVHVPLLFEQQRFDVIKELFFNVDDSITDILIGQGLVRYSSHPEVQKILSEGTQKGMGVVANILQLVLAQPGVLNSSRYIQQIIDRQDQDLTYYLIRHVLSQPHIENRRVFVNALLEQGHQVHYAALARFVFSHPSAATMTEELRRLVADADNTAMSMLGEHVFSQDYAMETAAFEDFLSRVRELRIPWIHNLPRGRSKVKCESFLISS